ncbi:MAG TPA: thiamine pyrophosphate-dependent enzyme [Thermoplasmata archaeon]|nr:thiamine pyrophosphate-dependent enzyme [Thermoplasmata archaeon]
MPSSGAAPKPHEAPTPSDPARPDLLAAYRTMVLARSVDERCLTLQRQGRIGFYVPMQGQEAAQVACASALAPEDWIFPAYRELGVALVRGIPLKLLLDQFIGNAGDELKGRQMPNHYGYRRFRFVTASSPVGTQISHAVGTAMAARRAGEPVVTATFFGDGTTSSNDFHAGLNFAGVFRAPTIFFCQNNQWAISLPRERQTHSATLAQKADAYGFPGVVVDGMDFDAVFDVVAHARARGLAGEGPTLIEAQVYRLGPHSTSDDPKRYRTDAQLAEWKEKDPVARVKHRLISDGRLDESSDTKIWDDAKEAIGRAIKEAEATPPVDPMTIFDDVFATPSPALEAEREQLGAWIRDGVVKP